MGPPGGQTLFDNDTARSPEQVAGEEQQPEANTVKRHKDGRCSPEERVAPEPTTLVPTHERLMTDEQRALVEAVYDVMKLESVPECP